ncbi:MAG TPA: AraC family transcriptional regulator [Polyangiaceae bacterium]|nr:AraC family transcriptional regulator [Polyangiaceae bacterium]
MGGRTSASPEIIDYRRSAALPGVEVIDAQHSPQEWRVVGEDHGLVMFRTWRGNVRTRGRLHTGHPGVVLCTIPGEAMVAKPDQGPGSFSVLTLRSELLQQWLAEQQPSSVQLDWAAVMQPTSARLRSQLCDFFETYEASAPAMQVQSQMLALSELLISELVRGAREPRASAGPPIRGTARMRECLNEEGLHIDLETLAKRAGLSRFHALRAFKQRYGLPPHAYQLCLRMNHARSLLRAGALAADVAQSCGFADQSHFTRHFKRFNGVTPMKYARAEAGSNDASSSAWRFAKEASALVVRSDR